MVRDNGCSGHGPPRAARILEALFAQLGSARLPNPTQPFVVWATVHGSAGQRSGTYAVDFRDGAGNRFSALYAERDVAERPQAPDTLGYRVGIF